MKHDLEPKFSKLENHSKTKDTKNKLLPPIIFFLPISFLFPLFVIIKKSLKNNNKNHHHSYDEGGFSDDGVGNISLE